MTTRFRMLVVIAAMVLLAGFSVCLALGFRSLDSVFWPYTGHIRNWYALRGVEGSSSLGRDCFVSEQREGNFEEDLPLNREKVAKDCVDAHVVVGKIDNKFFSKIVTRCVRDNLILERSFVNFRGTTPEIRDVCTAAVLSVDADPGIGLATKSDYEVE